MNKIKKLFNWYLELKSLNQFLLFIFFVVLNILLTKVYGILEIDIRGSYIYIILKPILGFLAVVSFLLIFKTPKITKSGKKKEGAPKTVYAILSTIMITTGVLFAYLTISALYDMSQSNYDFSIVVYGVVSGKAGHYSLVILLLFGSISAIISGIKMVIAIIKNEKIKDD